MFRVEKLLGSMPVSRKLTAGFVLVIALMAAASVANLTTTRSHLPGLEKMVLVDAILAFEGADLRAVLLEMRRYEKDLFLNIADAAKVTEYEGKWKEHYDEQIGTLDKLDKVAVTAADHEMLNKVRKETVAYGAAVKKTLADMRSGGLTTPGAANAAFTPSKDAMRELDEEITKWYESHEDATADGGATIERAMSSALLFTFVMTLLALAGSFTIAYLLARSIRRPLESAVLGARSVAQGRFEIDAPEELGQVQQAFDGVRNLLIETRDMKNKVENDNRELQYSITELLRVVASASDGDLTVRAPVSAGALGNVSDAFNSLLESLQDLLGVVAGQIKLTDTIVASVKDASTKMATGATTQSAELLDTSKLIQKMSADISKVSDGPA